MSGIRRRRAKSPAAAPRVEHRREDHVAGDLQLRPATATVSGPESVQRMLTKDTSSSAEWSSPIAMSTAMDVAQRAFSPMRWSGLSAEPSMNCMR
jgi:hypothetical protein